ncbi:hypothetical protein E5P68_01825 [Helicobacter pylori]|uniref:hypothetical protein n=1 Tax=Helicobacter pylori TaxID=210 RepID=UPI0012ACCFB8|nr:hypothetical protein [Helicobacter pylori]MCQ2868706.1 hypothetical protein [Helicobacter pylori]NID08012.1 hypothetical protein [Helicobacter pylori]WQX21014.1 hypothetical protein E5P68_01825 [Helicobacter pylori]WRE37923.1 hypothetical protein KVC35_01935 [Helicobacter pylori]
MGHSLIITETALTVASLMGCPTTNELKTQDPYQEKWGRLLTEYYKKERFKQQTK